MDDEKEIIEEEAEVNTESEEDTAPELEEDPAAEDGEGEAEEEGDDGVSVEDIEYDENGNAIIPEGIEKEETSTEDDEKEEEKAEEHEEPEAEEAEAEKAEEPPIDEKEARILALEERLALLESQGKDTLKLLGVENDDVLEGLTSLAAEMEDKATEDYKKERDERMQKKREEKAAEVAEFEKLAAKDLAELQAEYPQTKEYKHVRDMPRDVLAKFADLRNRGVSAVDAYAAANRDGIRAYAATSAKKATSNGKEHLQSSIPKASKNTAPKMTRADLEYWRGMFPKKSDKEIVALFRKTY